MGAAQRVVVVGNGIAGILVASNVRFLEPDPERASIDIFTRDQHEYFSRVRLPELFVQDLGAEALRIYKPEWYTKRAITVHRGETVTEVDRAARTLRTATGSTVPYDALVLCPGADAARLSVPGADLRGVFTLREYGDAEAINRYLRHGARDAAVVGGGLLGLEAAHFFQAAGVSVTILEREARLLPRQLDETGSRILRALVETPRCRVVLGARVEAFLGDETARAVRLQDGSEISAEIVLVAVGVTPRVELARAAGLEVRQGIVVDSTLRTSDPHIWAAGDAIEFQGVLWGMIPAAMEHAPVAAANLLGRGTVRYHKTIPRNTLKVAGISLESMGTVDVGPGPGIEIVERLVEKHLRYEKFVLRDGALEGCVLLGSRENYDFASTHIGKATTAEEVRIRLR